MESLDRGQLVVENASSPFEEEDVAGLQADYETELGEYLGLLGYGYQ